MGTPNYGPDLAKEIRDMKLAIGRIWTASSSLTKDGRPWSPITVSDVPTAMWPGTTSASFTSLQKAAGARSHPSLGYLVYVNAPAGGSEWRVIDSLSNVLLTPASVTSGTQSFSGTFSVPTGLDYYEDFNVYFQARSITAGQTTRLTIARIYGRT